MKKIGFLMLLLSFLAIFMYPDSLMQGAGDALALCAEKLIPALFPFFVLSGILTQSNASYMVAKWLSPVMRPLFRVSGAGALPLLLGIFGGYPVGIRTAAELYRRGEVSGEDYARLAGYCNNAGPLFILGTVGIGFFGNPTYGQILFLAHTLAAVCSGLLFRFYIPKKLPPLPQEALSPKKFRLSAVMEESLSSMLSVSGFVVLFGGALALLERLGFLAFLGRLFPAAPSALSCGLFELTAGLSRLSAGLPPKILLPIAGAILGWGGLCVHFQAVSLMEARAYFVPSYFAGKLLSSALTASFAYLFAHFLPDALPTGIAGIYPEILSPKELTLLLLVFLVSASFLFRFAATRKK